MSHLSHKFELQDKLEWPGKFEALETCSVQQVPLDELDLNIRVKKTMGAG